MEGLGICLCCRLSFGYSWQPERIRTGIGYLAVIVPLRWGFAWLPGPPIGSDGPLHRRALVVCRLIKGTFHFILQAIEGRAFYAVARTLWASLGKIRSTMDATRTTAVLKRDGFHPGYESPRAQLRRCRHTDYAEDSPFAPY